MLKGVKKLNLILVNNCIENSKSYSYKQKMSPICVWCTTVLLKRVATRLARRRAVRTFNSKMFHLVGGICCHNGLPNDLFALVHDYLVVQVEPWPPYCVVFGAIIPICAACCKFDVIITTSGRASHAPSSFSKERFITGSGIAGCDQYDRGFDQGKFYDPEEGITQRSDMSGFIVDDSLQILDDEITESSEEESCSDYSSSDEEAEVDQEWN